MPIKLKASESSLTALNQTDVVRRGDTVSERKSSWVVKGETGMHIMQELTVEGVEVLSYVCVEEGQLPLVVIQRHPNPQGMAGYSDVR